MTSKASHYSTVPSSQQKAPADPRPSSSIILLSPTNQVLLVHRVKTSSSFASAHVFPGGNLSEFHDGPVPPPGDIRRHEDGQAYRLGAIRETFEESGILLASLKGRDAGDVIQNTNGPLMTLPATERDAARKKIYDGQVKFGEWLESVGGIPDTGNLHPFTRWITPAATPKRFTTQMYLYMLPPHNSIPLPRESPGSSASAGAQPQADAVLPTPDGTEITTSVFEDASTWLARQESGEIILFPPQAFLLTLISQFCDGHPPAGAIPSDQAAHYQSQRQALLRFLHTTPTSTHPIARSHPTSRITWADKVISPTVALVRKSDSRSVLSLDKPGPELKGTGRGGDWERVVLVKFTKGAAREVEIRTREEVLEEERKYEAGAAREATGAKL